MAWLKKLLGKDQEREPYDPDEEPARVEPRYLQTGSQDATKVGAKPAATRGFDPYNSGSFKRDDAWSRVNRKK